MKNLSYFHYVALPSQNTLLPSKLIKEKEELKYFKESPMARTETGFITFARIPFDKQSHSPNNNKGNNKVSGKN